MLESRRWRKVKTTNLEFVMLCSKRVRKKHTRARSDRQHWMIRNTTRPDGE